MVTSPNSAAIALGRRPHAVTVDKREVTISASRNFATAAPQNHRDFPEGEAQLLADKNIADSFCISDVHCYPLQSTAFFGLLSTRKHTKSPTHSSKANVTQASSMVHLVCSRRGGGEHLSRPLIARQP